MSLDAVASALAPMAAGFDVAAGVAPPPVSTALRVLAAAARFAADLATKGIDPITHIERLHAHEDKIKDVHSAWRDRLEELYPKF